MKTKITALLSEKQPTAVAFGGQGVSNNPVCWVGTESGLPGGDVWTQGGNGLGVVGGSSGAKMGAQGSPNKKF